jgi:hypothetical protein
LKTDEALKSIFVIKEEAADPAAATPVPAKGRRLPMRRQKGKGGPAKPAGKADAKVAGKKK